jgi:predicted permease
MNLVLTILATVVPVFAIMGLGFLYSRFRPLPAQELTHLLFWILIPCLVLGSLGTQRIDPMELLEIGGSALIVLAVPAIFALGLCFRRPERRAVILASTFMNSANMAFPLALFAFGEAGLSRQVVFYVAVHALHVTLGLGLARGRGGVKEVFRLPLIYVAALAVVLAVTGTQLPKVVADPLNLVGRATIPLMLLLLGARLGSAKRETLPLASLAAILRLGVGFGAGLLAVYLFDLQGLARAAVLLGSVMPSAVFNFVLGERYSLFPELLATSVVLSTLVSIGTTPLALWFIGVG